MSGSWTRVRKADNPDVRDALRAALAKTKDIHLDIGSMFERDVADFFELMSGSAKTHPELMLTCLYPTIAVAMGPDARAQWSSSFPDLLTPVNNYILAASNPASGKSRAYVSVVESSVRLMEKTLQCNFLFSEITKNGLIQLQDSAQGYLMLGNDEAGSMYKEMLCGHQSDAMRALLNNHYSGNRYGYKSGTSRDLDVEDKLPHIATSVCTMTQLDNAAAVLHHMMDNEDGLLDRFIIFAPAARFYFHHQMAAVYQKVSERPKANHKNLPMLLHQVFELHSNTNPSSSSQKVYSFSGRAEDLLKRIHTEELARKFHLENKRWPTDEEMGGRLNTGYIPECAIGYGHNRFHETVVRISTVHHVLVHALRCLKDGSPSLTIPTTVGVQSVEQALQFVSKTSTAKAIIIEAYRVASNLPLATISDPVEDDDSDDADPSTANIPQASHVVVEKDELWQWSHDILLKKGQVLRVREDVKGKRPRGPSSSLDADTALARLVQEGAGSLLQDGNRKRYFRKAEDVPIAVLRKYGVQRGHYDTYYRDNGLFEFDEMDNTIKNRRTDHVTQLFPMGASPRKNAGQQGTKTTSRDSGNKIRPTKRPCAEDIPVAGEEPASLDPSETPSTSAQSNTVMDVGLQPAKISRLSLAKKSKPSFKKSQSTININMDSTLARHVINRFMRPEPEFPLTLLQTDSQE